MKNSIKVFVALTSMLVGASLLCMSGEDQKKARAFVEAAGKGDLNTVQQLLKEGVNIDAQGSGTMTALMAASVLGHKEVVEFLIKNGADVNALDGMDMSALMYAVYRGQKGIVEFLLKVPGIDVNIKGPQFFSTTAFDIASEKGHKEIVELLLPYVNKETLLGFDTSKLSDGQMKAFMLWLQKNAPITELSPEQIIKFVPIAFTIPACINEFDKLFKQLTKQMKLDDVVSLFNQDVIKKALMTRNLEAFKILISAAGHNEKLVDTIRLALDGVEDKNFANQVSSLLKQVPMKFKIKDISFGFQ